MNIKQIKVGVIHSSSSLVETIELVRKRADFSFEISTEGLEHAIPVGRSMEAKGIEVILSRKGTAHLLSENLSIPVISIPLSTLGVLKSLKEAMKVGHKVLLPCFRNIVDGLNEMTELLDIELVLDVYTDSASLKTLIRQAGEQGCQVVVGGGIAVKLARQFGLHGLEIKTSEDEILTSLETARSVVLTNRREKEKSQRYRCILKSVNEGIITYDTAGVINVVNQRAGEYLGRDQADMEDRSIQEFLPHVPVAELVENRKAVHEDLQLVNGKMFVFNHVPVVMDDQISGGVTTFVNANNLVNTEQRLLAL